jgi:hypothetical protein
MVDCERSKCKTKAEKVLLLLIHETIIRIIALSAQIRSTSRQKSSKNKSNKLIFIIK